jgi:hypothetical protein
MGMISQTRTVITRSAMFQQRLGFEPGSMRNIGVSSSNLSSFRTNDASRLPDIEVAMDASFLTLALRSVAEATSEPNACLWECASKDGRLCAADEDFPSEAACAGLTDVLGEGASEGCTEPCAEPESEGKSELLLEWLAELMVDGTRRVLRDLRGSWPETMLDDPEVTLDRFENEELTWPTSVNMTSRDKEPLLPT